MKNYRPKGGEWANPEHSCQQSQMQVIAGEMLSVMKVSISLEDWDIKEEEEQKILLSINHNSLEPGREKHSGVWEGKKQHYGGGQSIQNHWPQPAPAGISALLCQQHPTPLTIKFNHGWMKHWRMPCGKFVLLGAETQADFDFFVILMFISIIHMAAAGIDGPHHALVSHWWWAEV